MHAERFVRHTDIRLTMNTYARRELAGAAEAAAGLAEV